VEKPALNKQQHLFNCLFSTMIWLSGHQNVNHSGFNQSRSDKMAVAISAGITSVTNTQTQRLTHRSCHVEICMPIGNLN